MNAGGTDAAPTMAGPGLKLAPPPVIAIGAPTISVAAIATTATASATIDRSTLRHELFFLAGSVALEKIPRLRGVRAARVGGNCETERNSKSRRGSGKQRSAPATPVARAGTQPDRPVRTL